MTNIYASANKAIRDAIKDNMTIMVGGFGLCGIPEKLIQSIYDSSVKGLTIISNNCGVDDFGLGILLKNGQIKKMISSYVGENKTFEKLVLENKIEVELIPQGTLAERIRAAGAGIPAFYTPTGVGTAVAKNKESRVFNNKTYLMETSLGADLSIIKGYKSDKFGNIIYNKSARNFNPIMATASKFCICEVEYLVENLDPDNIHTPFIYVDRVLVGENYEKRIEKLTLSE